MYVFTEQCSTVNAGHLQKKITRIIRKQYRLSNSEEIRTLIEQELEKFELDGQRFKYDARPNQFGGYRWYFLCPKCGNRVLKLFLPPKEKCSDYRYLCKICHNLKNQSAVLAQNRTYRKVIRPYKKLLKIQERLNKGYLTEKKMTELLDEYDRLKALLKSTPEYRLYMLKKEQEILK